MSVRIRPQARIDIQELAERIGEDYPNAATAFLHHLDETLELLEKFPRIGAEAPFPIVANRAIRFFPIKRFRNYLIAFLPLPVGVEVLRVIDGRRDIGDIFADT
jgi:toxin ParE1/3/4